MKEFWSCSKEFVKSPWRIIATLMMLGFIHSVLSPFATFTLINYIGSYFNEREFTLISLFWGTVFLVFFGETVVRFFIERYYIPSDIKLKNTEQ